MSCAASSSSSPSFASAASAYLFLPASLDDLTLDAIRARPLAVAATLFSLFFFLQHWHVLPFTYHLRVLWAMLSSFLVAPRLRGLDDSVVTTHAVSWGSMDWNMHQNNSNYALEIDIQRYRWFMRLLKGNYSKYFDGLAIANGGVTHYFLKEMRWGQRYAISTRLVAADRKWMYLESRFTSLNGKTLFAVGLSRIVFKAKAATSAPQQQAEAASAGKRRGGGGRVTVAPVDALRDLGYDTSALPVLAEGEEPTVAGVPSPRSASALARVPSLVSSLLDVLEPGEAAAAATPRPDAAGAGGKSKRS